MASAVGFRHRTKVNPEPQQEDRTAPDQQSSTVQNPSKGLTRERLSALLLLLISGTGISIVAQIAGDLGFADDSVQALAWVKFASVVLFTSVSRWHRSTLRPAPQRSQRATWLMTLIGLLDVGAYCLHCIGFVRCGAALSIVIFSATGQALTALLTRVILKRQLSRGQVASVVVVCAALTLRGFAPSPVKAAQGSSATAGLLSGLGPGQLGGIAAILASSLGYSILGVAYDALLRLEQPPPSHQDVMDFTSKIGLVLNTLYQLVYTLPNWNSLVTAPMQANKVATWQALGALALFGMVYNIYTYAVGLVFRVDGALGVGLANAVRSATVSVVSGIMFCTSAKPWQCLTPWTAASAAAVTAGGMLWVLSGDSTKRSQQAKSKRK